MANVIRQDWTALETLKARNASPFICSTEQNFFRKKSVKKKIQEHSLQNTICFCHDEMLHLREKLETFTSATNF